MPDDRRHTMAAERGDDNEPYRHTYFWGDEGDPEIAFYVDLEGKYRLRRIGEKQPNQTINAGKQGRK